MPAGTPIYQPLVDALGIHERLDEAPQRVADDAHAHRDEQHAAERRFADAGGVFGLVEGKLAGLMPRRPGKKLVTAALPTGRLQTDGPYDPAKSFELRELSQIMDFINVMTYDMGTGFSPVATFNAPFREVANDPMPPADRKAYGQEANRVKEALTAKYDEALAAELAPVERHVRGLVVRELLREVLPQALPDPAPGTGPCSTFP